MTNFLLTIAIPTYNRADLLRQCISAIVTQIPADFAESVEIIVSNNASSDNTKEVVEEMSAKWPIVYFENVQNLGPDANILQCFTKAQGRYVWIFSDDELLLPGVMKHLLNLLPGEEYGIIHLVPVAYYESVSELSHYYNPNELNVTTYTDAIKFYSYLSYMATFITSIILNKAILPEDVNYGEFLGTNLVQLGWVMRAVFSGKKNVTIPTNTLACKQENSGGYKFITTFSKNYNTVLRGLVKQGIDSRVIDITNEHLITRFLPGPLKDILYKPTNFYQENGFSVLVKCFGKYSSFWKVIFPIYASYWLNVKMFPGKHNNNR